MRYIKAYDGGSVYLNAVAAATFSSITVENSEARRNGGFIYSVASTLIT